MIRELTPTSVGNEGMLSMPAHLDVDAELAAIGRGELRSMHDINFLYEQLRNGSTHQRAEAEHLGLGLLVEAPKMKLTPTLVIDVSPDLKTLRYGEMMETLSLEDLNSRTKNGRLFANDLKIDKIKWWLEIKDPRQISPTFEILAREPNKEGSQRVMEMIVFNDRITFFGDIPATWAGYLDNKVWSTNIDTVNFIKWLREDGAFSQPVKCSLEIGPGAGGISQALLHDNPEIAKHIISDINAHAINATKRNLAPFIDGDQLVWYLGKGVRSMHELGQIDLGVCNPPYIPHPLGQDAVDPYRGTGLIREIFELLPKILNRDNPNAAFYIQISNLTLKDLARYQAEFPNVKVTPVGEPVEVPLKIWGVSRELGWYEFLRSYGLIDKGDEHAAETGLRYYHQISAVKLTLQ